MITDLSQNELKSLYEKGYRYQLRPLDRSFVPLVAKGLMDIGPVMREYPKDRFEVSYIQPDGSLKFMEDKTSPTNTRVDSNHNQVKV